MSPAREKPPSKGWRLLRRFVGASAAIPPILLALFYWNGTNGSWRDLETGTTLNRVAASQSTWTLMAWNIAKCDFHQGGLNFRSEDDVRGQLDKLAAVILEQNVDVLFLSEAVFEAFPCQVNQVKYLAEKAGFLEWCYGDNYSFGIPGVRVRSGNAILSKLPLRALRVDSLPGKSSVWNPTGQRRLPWASVEWAGSTILLGSIRNDSFDLENNALQVRTILESLPESPVILGGDFNAEPGDESMERLKRSGHWRGVFQGAATFPAHAPHRRIDSVLIPSAWHGTLEHRVLDVDLSDHEPVVVTVTLR